MRVTFSKEHQPRVFGPKAEDHPSVGQLRTACDQPFKAGDMTALIPLGPGADEEAREKAKNGGYFNAVAVEVHSACAGTD